MIPDYINILRFACVINPGFSDSDQSLAKMPGIKNLGSHALKKFIVYDR